MFQGVFIAEDGACKGHPTDWWFPLQKTGRSAEVAAIKLNTLQAKSICVSCSQKKECLDYSLEWEPWGIWGGMTEQERAEIRWKEKVNLGREGRIIFKGIGMRDANGGDFLLHRDFI